jgi:hypothetical protein
LRIDDRQRVQGIVDGHDGHVSPLRCNPRIQRHSNGIASATLVRGSPACVLHENATNEMGRDSEEMRPILPLDAALIDELKIGIVRQSRGLKRVTWSLPAQVMVGDPAQLSVDFAKQLLSGVLIPLTPGDEQLSDV